MNKQLYKNSGLKELFEASQAVDSPTADGEQTPRDPLSTLFNGKEPNLAILHEKPEHRLLLYMKAQGASNREIAQQSGYTEPWLSQLFRQPWARERLVAIMNETGKDEVSAILKAAAADSVYTLIDLRDDADAPAAVRRSAADSLLDRYLGKPKQQVEVQQRTLPSVEEVDRELAALAAEEQRLMGRAASVSMGETLPEAQLSE